MQRKSGYFYNYGHNIEDHYLALGFCGISHFSFFLLIMELH